MKNTIKTDRLRKLIAAEPKPLSDKERAELRTKIERMKKQIEANGRELRKLSAAYDRPAGRLH